MPAKSKSQQRFFGVVKGIQKGTGKGTGKAKKAATDMSSTDVDDFASTKHKGLPNKVKREQRVRELIKKIVREEMAKMNEDFAGALPKQLRKKFDKGRQKQSEVLGYKLTGTPDIKTEIDDATVKEAKKRDYKAEYKKFQSSTKSKKYRAELNAYNRKKGTYGNGDGKDASHKGGKIVGFEAESKNRGRREKSRLKKEGKLNELEQKHKTFFLNQIEKDITSLKGQIAYAKDKVNYKGTPDWEKKEFKAVLKDLLKDLKDMIARQKRVKKWEVDEGKLTEDFKNNEWEVYVADENRKEKIVKVAKSKRAAVILYNKLIKTDKYHEVGMRVIKEGKINERMDKRKAATILKQIGGNRFIAMTGAKGFAFSNKYMSFKIGRNSKGINFVRIGHNAKDLYDMEFGFVSTKGIKVKKKVKDVYADMLGQIFKKHTGMNVRL